MNRQKGRITYQQLPHGLGCQIKRVDSVLMMDGLSMIVLSDPQALLSLF